MLSLSIPSLSETPTKSHFFVREWRGDGQLCLHALTFDILIDWSNFARLSARSIRSNQLHVASRIPDHVQIVFARFVVLLVVAVGRPYKSIFN